MIKKVLVSLMMCFALLIGSFGFIDNSEDVVEAAPKYSYNWYFKTQQATVKLDTNYSFTGYEVYRGFTNKVGLTMKYKISSKGVLTVTGVDYYKYGIMWPVKVADKSKRIVNSKTKVGGAASAYADYRGQIITSNGISLLTEYPKTEGYIKLVSVNTTNKTAVVQFTGVLRH
ncbi:hypothetical protein [Metabacillus iocasae]|uniref:Uncharacterized protein n=1 Tax=Priestia iocasae TaxID=2291674 RepID=A0ABS2QS75_9BACI|nr:hypothetical protein [Metabacillus iocasae]MBM7702299.1 hypothetical protein [Metabacillus iocasae]